MSAKSKITGFVATLNPAAIQAVAIKYLAIFGVLSAIVIGSYALGRHDGKQAGLSALKTVAARVAEKRADNAVQSAHRFAAYSANDRDLDMAVDKALTDIHDYYAANPETKLVKVPGKKEKQYVPNDSCPGPVFSPDELQLFNLGNERRDFDAGDSK